MPSSINQVVSQMPYEPYIIFDIDGTLANDTHRKHWISSASMDWDQYHNLMSQDTLIKAIAEIYYKMCDGRHNKTSNNPAIFITGRPESHRQQTIEWLQGYGLVPHYLFMRPVGDFSPSIDFKRNVLINYVKKAPVLFVVEDRAKLVKMFREMGYHTLQCQEGEDCQMDDNHQVVPDSEAALFLTK